MNALQTDRPLVVFDVETTGVNAQRDRIVELAAIRVETDGTERTATWLVDPGVSISAENAAIHGITDDIVKGCPTFADVAEEVLAFFADADLCGFDLDRLDVPILVEEFARAGLDFGASDRRRVDVQRIYHRKEPRDLKAAVKFYCGRDHAQAHGAEADARATLDVMRAQMARYADVPHDVAALDEWLVPRDPCNLDRLGTIRFYDGAWRVNFGKKKGATLLDLFRGEKNYLKWIVHGNFDSAVRAACKNLLDNGVLPPAPRGAK